MVKLFHFINYNYSDLLDISLTVVFERSCDTEDWNNDAENSALNHRNTF